MLRRHVIAAAAIVATTVFAFTVTIGFAGNQHLY